MTLVEAPTFPFLKCSVASCFTHVTCPVCGQLVKVTATVTRFGFRATKLEGDEHALYPTEREAVVEEAQRKMADYLRGAYAADRVG